MKQFETKEEKQAYLKKIKFYIYGSVCACTLMGIFWVALDWYTKTEYFYAGECVLFKEGEIYKIEKLSEHEEVFYVELLYHKEPKLSGPGTKMTKSRDDFAIAQAQRVDCPQID